MSRGASDCCSLRKFLEGPPGSPVTKVSQQRTGMGLSECLCHSPIGGKHGLSINAAMMALRGQQLGPEIHYAPHSGRSGAHAHGCHTQATLLCLPACLPAASPAPRYLLPNLKSHVVSS